MFCLGGEWRRCLPLVGVGEFPFWPVGAGCGVEGL